MSPSQNKLFFKWSEAFDSARHKLLAIRQQEGIEEVKRKGIIIDKNVSLSTYLEFCKGEPSISVKHHLIDGKIEAYEMPLDPHSLIQAKLTNIMDNWNDQLLAMGETDIIVNANSVYRPDICVRPVNRRRPSRAQAINSTGLPYPTMVVEIGSTESLNHMHDKVANYFSVRTTIQIYLAIKLYLRLQNNTFALLALLYLRNNQNPTIPVIAKSFGIASLSNISRAYLLNTIRVPVNMITGVDDEFGGIPCNGANIPGYQIDIPAELLFNDVPDGVPGDAPVNFNIDLWKLQNRISVGLSL
ncbi:3687_t:CDS:1 [Diversispora eburnea]|uniref:3687_t:CDS:1 n=1 Tax=Diversispora eburnea TaxID=1213867 RepID=A0A9N8Z8K3_9GLOM|nr:3687_t:CDS:1 [Diversispora eburnea]